MRGRGRIDAGRRGLVVLIAAGLVAGPVAPVVAQDAADPAVVGRFLPPFVERPEDEACVERESDPGVGGTELVCKPTAVTSVVLPDGRVVYWNGVEGSENVAENVVLEGGRTARNSQARVLDLRGETPLWTVPDPEDGGAVSPDILAGSPAAPDDPARNDGDMFCTDQKHLADGRLLIVGGTDWYTEPFVPTAISDETPFPFPLAGEGTVELQGLRNTRIFDPATDDFEQIGAMSHGRWYPSLVTLPDGDVWVAGGVTKLIQNNVDNEGTTFGQVRITETLDLETMTWSENDAPDDDSDVLRSLPLFPRVQLTPNGKIFYYGAGQTFGPMGHDPQQASWGIPRYYDTAAGAWEAAPISTPQALTTRGGAFQTPLLMAAPYDEMTLLVGGGTLGPTPGSQVALPLSERVTVSSDGSVSAEMTAGQLNNPRWFSASALLPTGEVFIASGADKDEVVAPGNEHPVHQSEIYDPATDSWTPVASIARDRTYHNSAVLLPDGRVLVGGHSPIPYNYTSHRNNPVDPEAAANFKDASFEIYEPPYLHRGERPTVTYAPAAVAWGSDFDVDVCSTSDIASVSLIRVPAQTHIIDADMRGLALDFEVTGDGQLSVVAPPDGLAAPPGPYYLFVNRETADGPVPSAARIVMLGEGSDATIAPEPMPDPGPSCSVAAEAPTTPAPTPTSAPLPTTGGPALPALLGLGALLITSFARPRRTRGDYPSATPNVTG